MSIKAFAGLGAAQIGYALAAVAVAGLVGFGGGVYVGGEWQRGQDAQAEVQALRTDAALLQAAARSISARANEGADRLQRTAFAIDAIHERWEAQSREVTRRMQAAAVDLRTYRDSDAARVDCIDPEFVRLWNNAASVAADATQPATATAADHQPADVRPEPANAAAGREQSGRSGELVPGGGAIPGVRDSEPPNRRAGADE
jgi:hypothetical protein